MHRTLVKSITSNHTLLVSEVDYKQENILFQKLKKNQIQLDSLGGLKNKARRIEWMTVRSVLIDYYQDLVDVQYDDHNKPHLKHQEDSISISHSHHKIALSLKKDPLLDNGVDIQHVNSKIMAIREKFLSEPELNLIPKLDVETLGQYWSIKEALFKVYGKKDIYLKDHIHIEEFDTKKQLAIGLIKTKDFKKRYSIQFEIIDNYTLAYIVNG